jgi:hypothetical protein
VGDNSINLQLGRSQQTFDRQLKIKSQAVGFILIGEYVIFLNSTGRLPMFINYKLGFVVGW